MTKRGKGEIKRLLETIDTLERQLDFERYNTDACRSWAVYYQNLWFGRTNHIDKKKGKGGG